jgi:hypothetical protein
MNFVGRSFSTKRLALLLLIFVVQRKRGSVQAANPFSSNVVALDANNWREEVLESPHAVLVNICRVG